MTETYSVYRIVCFPTGKCYVGQTGDVERRIKQHLVDLARGRSQVWNMQKDYDEYGSQSFYVEILERNVPAHAINLVERYWIKCLRCCENGYNLSPGGGRSMKKHVCISPEEGDHLIEYMKRFNADMQRDRTA